MKDRTNPANGVKVVLAVLAASLLYALLISAYNGLVGEDWQLDVVRGALNVAIAGSLSILGLWIFQNERQKRKRPVEEPPPDLEQS